MFLSALDDNFFGPHIIRQAIEQCNENIIIAVTKAGGHCCYFQGNILPTS